MPARRSGLHRTIACATLALGLSACERGGCVALRRPEPLLEQPHPMLPQSREPNRVLTTLPAGPYQYRRTVYGKDYMMYEVRADTLRGFVQYSSDAVDDCR